MRKTLVGIVVCAGLVLGTGSAAFAGERSGTGAETAGPSHAKSLCVFSGLEDFDFEAPVQPGVVQNWGHVKQEFGLTGGANSVQTPFGEEGCNAHLYPNPEK
ncbi:MAG: hypothetical protein ABIX10_10600 [Acidimicrobiales bacterium]